MVSISEHPTVSQSDKPGSNNIRDFDAQASSLGNAADISAANRNRVRKFRALDYARQLLQRYDVRNTKGKIPHRTRFCFARRARKANRVVIKLNNNDINSEASIGNVQTCGSVWSCPVCASRIAVKKGYFVKNTIAWAKHNKLIPVMVSVTARHHAGMPLEDLKARFIATWRDFTNRRAWKAFKLNFGVEHWIANREVTHGENGWHYHMHFLVFLDRKRLALMGSEALEEKLTTNWLHCLKRHDLNGLPDYALKVSAHGDVGSSYLTKMGLTVSETDDNLKYELTGSMNKRGSRTVWDILRHAYYGDANSERLYVEYVIAMQGDNFITTSHGLTDCVENFLDEFPEEPTETKEMHDWLTMSDDIWRIVADAYAMHRVIDCAARDRSKKKIVELVNILKEELLE